MSKSQQWSEHWDAVGHFLEDLASTPCAQDLLVSNKGEIWTRDKIHNILLQAYCSREAKHKAQQCTPLWHTFNVFRGFCLPCAGRREAALVHYEAALGLDPQHTVALVNTAALMTSLHHNTQAERLYKRWALPRLTFISLNCTMYTNPMAQWDRK